MISIKFLIIFHFFNKSRNSVRKTSGYHFYGNHNTGLFIFIIRINKILPFPLPFAENMLRPTYITSYLVGTKNAFFSFFGFHVAMNTAFIICDPVPNTLRYHFFHSLWCLHVYSHILKGKNHILNVYCTYHSTLSCERFSTYLF